MIGNPPHSDRPIYFVSDTHISGADNPRTARLVRFLRDRSGEAEAVYLVGDIFEFWLSYRSVIPRAYFPLLRAIAELVESGTRVVLFSGNHDPDPGSFFSHDLGLEVHERGLSTRIGPHRVWIEHGDLIDPRGWIKRAVCQIVHVPVLRRAARLAHPDIAWSGAELYGRALGRLSKRRNRRLPPAIIDSYLPARAAEGHDVVIMGHYHRTVVHRATHAGRRCELFVLGDWLRYFTWLRYDGSFTLWRACPVGGPPIAVPPGDHDPQPTSMPTMAD